MRNRIRKLVLAMFFVILCGQNVVFAQETAFDLKKEIDELKQGQKSIQDDLKMIKTLLLQGQKPAQKPDLPQVNVRDVEFEIGDNPVKGDDSAPLVIVEFTDYQCSFCARHSRETLPEITKKYIDTGKLRYVIIDNPLSFHEKAGKAAEAAHCADEQGKFQDMHDKMMNNPESISDLNAIASSLNLDMQKFRSCMDEKKYAGKVVSNISLASRLNISSVPGFVIASRDPDNPKKVKGISFILGAMPFTLFQKEIDQSLAGLTK